MLGLDGFDRTVANAWRTNGAMSTLTHSDRWAGLLADPDVREVGGEHTNEGIDYARFLAMALIVEMEKKSLQDYALLFEYLQDIAILNSSTNPTRVTLLQVKKKVRGGWTKAKLCAKEPLAASTSTGSGPGEDASEAGGEPISAGGRNGATSHALAARSPIGKLYLCVDKLSLLTDANGVFVSNAGAELKRKGGGAIEPYSRTRMEHLHHEDRAYIRKRLAAELKRPSLNRLSRLAVEQSRVAPASMREAVRGLIDEMLSSKYPTLPSVSGQLQETLLAAFSSCSGLKTGLESLPDLVNKKGFTRSNLTDLIAHFSSMRTAGGHLDTVIAGLKSEGMPARAADKLRSEAGRLQIQLVREPQTREALLWDVAIEAANAHKEVEEYRAALSAIANELKAQAVARSHGPTSDRETEAVALLALIHVDQEPTPSSSEPSGQNR